MHRKDYIMIAEVIKEAVGDYGANGTCFETVIDALTVIFKQDDPRFNAYKFRIACGLTEETVEHRLGYTDEEKNILEYGSMALEDGDSVTGECNEDRNCTA